MHLPYLFCQLVVWQNNLSMVSMRGDRFTNLLEDQRPGSLLQLIPIECSRQGLTQFGYTIPSLGTGGIVSGKTARCQQLLQTVLVHWGGGLIEFRPDQ